MASTIERVPIDGRVVNVVRFDWHVTLHDSPNPSAHAGWTMHPEQARELGEALIRAASSHPAGSV